MTKARDLANLISAGNPLADGAISVAEISDLTASAAELNYNDITTLGTVEASKVVTANADGNVTFPDTEVLRFGNTADLQIYHSGSNSIIADMGTGNLKLLAENFSVQDPNQTEQMILATPNGSVNLYYDGNKKIETTSDGATTTGNHTISEGGQYKFGTGGTRIAGSVASNYITFHTNGGAEKFRVNTSGADVSGELIADSYNETYSALSGTTPTVNCEAGNAFSLTLSGNTTFTFSNPPASGTSYTFSIEIIQDASASGYTVTWPASVDWPAATAPTLTATASAKDIFVFTTRDGGTNWYGFTAGQALA